MKPTILLYNFNDPKRKAAVAGFCARNGIRAKAVKKQDYGKPLAEILGLAPALSSASEEIRPEAEAPSDFEEEMLVMCELGTKTNPLLTYLRRERVIVPLKAMLTPVNQRWSSLELYGEISEERRKLSDLQTPTPDTGSR